MSIENSNNNQLEEVKEMIKIEKTSDFQEIIKNALELFKNKGDEKKPEIKKLLCEVEDWLNSNRERVDDEGRWVDHQEYTLFKAYRTIKDWDSANRIIESMQDTKHAQKVGSKQGRIDILSKEMAKENEQNL